MKKMRAEARSSRPHLKTPKGFELHLLGRVSRGISHRVGRRSHHGRIGGRGGGGRSSHRRVSGGRLFLGGAGGENEGSSDEGDALHGETSTGRCLRRAAGKAHGPLGGCADGDLAPSNYGQVQPCQVKDGAKNYVWRRSANRYTSSIFSSSEGDDPWIGAPLLTVLTP